MEPIIIIGLLPKRDTSQPETGRLVINPAGSANNTAPSPASDKCNFAWIAGMRLAQVENVNPAIKKNMLVAILYFLNKVFLYAPLSFN